MKNNKYIKILNENISEIKQFITSNISNTKLPGNPNKININCPHCDGNKNKHKMIINLDWGNFRCYKCGYTGSLYKLMDEFNIKENYLNLISNLSNVSLYHLQTLIRNNNIINETVNDDFNKKEDNIVNDFIKKYGLININKIKDARNYALSRTFNNENEIESYLADDKYIYIPIIVNETIVAYMGRLYMKNNNLPRYVTHVLKKDIPMIGFYDEVVNNISTNSLYITEGYFDSLAINYSMANFISICMFGKSKAKTVTDFIADKFPNNTNIYITLDSKVKDSNINKDIINIGKYLSKIYSNIFVVELSNEDPSDILNKYGAFALKKELSKKVTPFLKYIIMNSGGSKKCF